jgi:tetratricopeptide (TPR) repeat protein
MRTVVLLLAMLAINSPMSAQNTIGGVKREVSEAEIKIQTEFLNAESARVLGKHDKAVQLYKEFLYRHEQNDAAWYGLSRTYAAIKERGSALDAVAKAIKINPDNKWYYIHQAEMLEQGGQAKAAAEVYETMTKRFDKEPELLEKLAYLHTVDKNPKAALKALERLENITGVSERSSTQKHLIYVAMGDNKRAAEALQRLSDAYPSKLEFRRSLAKFYAEIGDQPQSLATWQEVLKRNPSDAEARLAVAAKAPGQAKIAALQPVMADARVSVDEKVKELMPLILELEKSQDVNLSTNLIELVNLVEKAHPDDPKAWAISGDVYYLSQRDAEALSRYERCIALKPRVFSVWDNALTLLSRQPTRLADMLPLAEKAIDAFPNQPKAYYWYGWAANASNQPAKGIPVLQQGLLMCGNNNALWLEVADQLGMALLAQKDYSAAAKRYEQALAKGGEQHAGILEHYGDVLAAQGQREPAKTYWKKAAALRSSESLNNKIKS